MSEPTYAQQVEEAAAALRAACPQLEARDYTGIVLGSGLGSVADALEGASVVDYADVPHMPISSAPLHRGRFVIGTVGETGVICMQGRLHSYEGYSARQVAFPVYVLHALGVRDLFLTCAAGGINASFQVGDLMLVEDHINFLFRNPCIGQLQLEDVPRFFDMTNAYAPELLDVARRAASSIGLRVRSGVLVSNPGPSFETPAEVRAYRTLGADAVCMSTVLETIAANSCSMNVLAVAMISNPAAGVCDGALDMDDVQKAAQVAAADLERLLTRILAERA